MATLHSHRAALVCRPVQRGSEWSGAGNGRNGLCPGSQAQCGPRFVDFFSPSFSIVQRKWLLHQDLLRLA
jgi:hypothetical protein